RQPPRKADHLVHQCRDAHEPGVLRSRRRLGPPLRDAAAAMSCRSVFTSSRCARLEILEKGSRDSGERNCMTHPRHQQRWEISNGVAPGIYFGLDRKLCGIYWGVSAMPSTSRTK